MKFTLSWLKEHLTTTATAQAIADKLTMLGLEVEKLDDKAKLLAPFSIARVISAEQHPNADRLRVCMVDTGAGDPVQVVCGAPNARAGMKGVFVPPGAYIPGKDLTLSVGKIRGVESRGMLVSEFELQLSEDHEGIIELPDDAPVGENYAAWAGVDDPVFEIKLTPNRGDCTAVHGIARDLAAAGVGELKSAEIAPVSGRYPFPSGATVTFGDTPSLCRGFALRLVRGVKNGPSPDWLARRLTAIGLRPINTLIDITNFITYDRGRPLHVFDAAKVNGELTVRRARSGETLLALDGKTYQLDDTMCVIADESGPELLAGIMGGEATGCSEGTTDVLIELALWEPINIAQTGRKLGINSDARYRFERGVDPAFMIPGIELATRLVLDLCGGEPSQITIAEVPEIPDSEIAFPFGEIKRLTGLELDAPAVRQVLERLGFEVGDGDTAATVKVPSWRPDVHGSADLVEEIVRIVGVDRVPTTAFVSETKSHKPMLTTAQVRTRRAKRALATRGLLEAMTWSFIAHEGAELFGGGARETTLANPIASDLSDMRPSLLPGLIGAAQRNADRGFADVAIFEVGQIFKGTRPQDQLTAAAGVRRSLARPSGSGRHWSSPTAEVDAFDAKADAWAVLSAAGAAMSALQVVPGGPSSFHPGRSGTIQLGPQNVLGYFGEIHPRTLEALDAAGPLVAFEVILDKIPEPKVRGSRARAALELSSFQPIGRDFAFIVDREAKSADIVRAAQNVDRKLITSVAVFDVFEGKGIAPGKKSVAIAVTIQPRERTLTDEEIEQLAGKIVAEVTKRTGATLRA